MDNRDTIFGTELLKKAEDLFSKNYKESIKFHGFVTVKGFLQIRFVFVNKGSINTAFACSWELLDAIINGDLLKKAEEKYSINYGEQVKFHEFVIVEGNLQTKFIFEKKSTNETFISSWKNLAEILGG
jgi:methionyl-tRNA synthetase